MDLANNDKKISDLYPEKHLYSFYNALPHRHEKLFAKVKWINILNGTVRPVMTYVFFIIYIYIKYIRYISITHF